MAYMPAVHLACRAERCGTEYHPRKQAIASHNYFLHHQVGNLRFLSEPCVNLQRQ